MVKSYLIEGSGVAHDVLPSHQLMNTLKKNEKNKEKESQNHRKLQSM